MALTEGNSFLVSSLLSLLTFSAMQVDHGRRAQGRRGPHRQGRRGPRSQGLHGQGFGVVVVKIF